MARYSKKENSLRDAIGAVCFVLVTIAVIVGLVSGPDKGFNFLFWVSQKIVGFVMPGLYSSP